MRPVLLQEDGRKMLLKMLGFEDMVPPELVQVRGWLVLQIFPYISVSGSCIDQLCMY